MKRISRKIKKTAIILISIILILLAAFFAYWAFTAVMINRFTTLETSEIGAAGNFIKIRGADIYYIEKGYGGPDIDTVNPKDIIPDGSGSETGSSMPGCGNKNVHNIILIHGIGGGAFTYRNNINELAAAGFNVYAIDLKGFGYSERAIKSDYSHIEQAEILLEFMEEKQIGKATVAGHSMGGRVALIAYDKKPEKFEKLILIDSAGLEETSGRQNNAPVYSGALPQAVVDILYYNLFLNSQRFKNFLLSAFYNKDYVDDEVISYYLEPFKVKNTNKAYRYILKGNVFYDIKPVLSKIDIPVLIIWGDNDGWIDVGNAHIFNKLIKGSILEIIKDAGHLPMEEQAESFNDSVIDFMGPYGV